ncbi:Hypothetical predicted protein [Paramuricea clavata]|uniref:Uncharacterized protein n=1 Tax=Paramuricea clavata TaxID=317549 RepID=A0A6S7G8Y4_PARCT|nr:Hypothetical predicted protein [Paramuricea clavata]
MSNNLKRTASPVRGCNNTHKRKAEFSTPPRPPRIALDPIVNNSTPSCSTPANLSDTCTQNNRFTAPFPPSVSDNSNDNLIPTTPVQFVNNSPLREEELLLYSMMTLVFPIYQITGVKYSSHSIRNYFHRVYTNKVKGFGKTKGTSNHLLTPVLQGEQLDETTMNSLLHQLKSHCIQQGTSTPLDNKAECCLDKEYDINYVNQMFEKTIMLELNSKWSKQFNSDKNTIHFYQFGKCLGYAEKEISLTAAGTWSIFLEGKHRSVDLGWTDIPDTGTIDALKGLLKFMESDKFQEEYGELFLIPGKLNQDFVESFFSCQRQMCGGTQNMTAYVYAYNINGCSCFQTAKALGKKQTNVYELEETLSYFEGDCKLPRRRNDNSIFKTVEWYIEI